MRNVVRLLSVPAFLGWSGGFQDRIFPTQFFIFPPSLKGENQPEMCLGMEFAASKEDASAVSSAEAISGSKQALHLAS